MMTPLSRCQLCGSTPTIACDENIVPGMMSWAIHCSDPENCYNDTHWQSSFDAAVRIWQTEQPCVGIRGGQGSPDDDDAARAGDGT